jgi:hypothetical protein
VIGRIQDAWPHLTDSVWKPLGDYSAPDGTTAPLDLYGDLFAAASDYVAMRPVRELEDARSDPERAREIFLALEGSDFANEASVIGFLEEATTVVASYDLVGFEDRYHQLLTSTLETFNLRYRVETPFALRFLIPGSFANLYHELGRLAAGNAHVAELMADFEISFDRYARTQDAFDLRVCIGKVSNYAEGLASATAGYPTTGNTLGALVQRLSQWPHKEVMDSVVSLYHFCSDYPGVRHGGTPKGQLRPLDARDSVAVSVALLSLAAYLGDGLDNSAVLGFGPGSRLITRRIVERPMPGKRSWIRRFLTALGLNR